MKKRSLITPVRLLRWLSLLFLVCLSTALLIANVVLAVADERQLADASVGQKHQRFVVLGPHLVEAMFAIGAGQRIVGTSDFADYPARAKSIPRVASHSTVNYELIQSLQVDWVLVWQSGFGQDVVDRLRELGMQVYVSEPSQLHDIALLLEELGALTGRQDQAQRVAADFRDELLRTRERYRNVESVTAFYQVWHEPLQTLNGRHIVSAVIELCGGRNVFADAPVIAPKVSVESVIAANPQVILASASDGLQLDWRESWLPWPMIDAVAGGQLHFVEPDTLVRHSPRILEGIRQVCAILDSVRANDDSL